MGEGFITYEFYYKTDIQMSLQYKDIQHSINILQ